MSRLTHSFSGYLRQMQISEATLYVFVEGYTDRFFYSKIVESEDHVQAQDYRIATARELLDYGGGKELLLRFFEYLKRRSSLINRFKGKTTVSILFLDKDVDDFLRTKRRSEHVVYTQMYAVENYLFVYGDLTEAAAASASLDKQSVSAHIGGHAVWRMRAANQWKKWVQLCLFSQARMNRPMPYYRRPRSEINERVYGDVNVHRYAAHLAVLRKQSGLPSNEFKKSFSRLCKRIDKIYAEGQHDLIFKGEWYASFLCNDIKRIAAGRDYQSRGLEKRTLSNLALSLNFHDLWADHLREPIRILCEKSGI